MSDLPSTPSLSPEETRRILSARARELAREPETESLGERLEVVEFALAHERYAVESARVREVFALKELSTLPCTPPWVRGIINVRGEILTVIDLKRFFDLPEKGLSDLNKVIILSDENGVGERTRGGLGVLVDAVLGVRALALDAIQPPPPTLSGVGAEYLRGVTAERMAVLDVTKILADPKLIVDEEVAI